MLLNIYFSKNVQESEQNNWFKRVTRVYSINSPPFHDFHIRPFMPVPSDDKNLTQPFDNECNNSRGNMAT